MVINKIAKSFKAEIGPLQKATPADAVMTMPMATNGQAV